MQKSLSFTVHPSALGGEYLTVSDAMRQVLDLVEALERTEGAESERRIVWRLTEAHTNSPPFTVTASAYPVDPVVSITVEAERVASEFLGGVAELLRGETPDWLDPDVIAPLKRAFRRNTNGVGQTLIQSEGKEPINVVPTNAQSALATIGQIGAAEVAAGMALRRTEYGSIEAEVVGITRWNDRPALTVVERLSGNKVTCILEPELAEQLGPVHRWNEVWENGRVLLTGALHYNDDGILKRVNVTGLEPRPFTDVSLAELRDIDLLQGRSVSEHIRRIRGEEVG